MGLYLLEPVLHRIERRPIVDSEDHDYPHSPLVIGLSDGLEAFLASGVPNLHTNFFAVDFDGLNLEVDSLISGELPMVVRWEVMKLFSQKRKRILVLPTPLSPIINSFAKWSYPCPFILLSYSNSKL